MFEVKTIKKLKSTIKKKNVYRVHRRGLLQIWRKYPDLHDDPNWPPWPPRTNVQDLFQALRLTSNFGQTYRSSTYWFRSSLPLSLLWKNIQKQKSSICSCTPGASGWTQRISGFKTTTQFDEFTTKLAFKKPLKPLKSLQKPIPRSFMVTKISRLKRTTKFDKFTTKLAFKTTKVF